MSRLLLLRLSLVSFKKYINTKIPLIINLSIFVIIFALTASGISIIFENRVEKLETNIIKNEVNQIVYNKWINKSPKIIEKINNVYQNRRDQMLFRTLIKNFPDDERSESSMLYNNRNQYYQFTYFLENIIEDNFKNMDLALTDTILLSNNSSELNEVKQKKDSLRKLIMKYDKVFWDRVLLNRKSDLAENFEEMDVHYNKYKILIDKYINILETQKKFFLDFGRVFFLKKREYFTKKNSEDLAEITDLAILETRFILFAFIIQFIIFIFLQIFEVTIERERKK